jgi:hypothetical protein
MGQRTVQTAGSLFCACQQHGLARALAWVIEGANLFQFSADNKTQIHNMIYAVNRLHVENGRDIIAVDKVLLYFYTPDEWQNAREETHYRLATHQFRHQWPFKGHAGCERHGGQVFARETVQIAFYYRYVF